MTDDELTSLRTGEVARRAGVNIQTLRYYERRGLIAQPGRSLGGHRTYPPDTVALLGIIKAAQRLGFTLDEVAELLDTGRRRHPPTDLRERAATKLVEVEAKLRDLSTIRDTLQRVVAAHCDSLSNCSCADCPLPFADLAGTASPHTDNVAVTSTARPGPRAHGPGASSSGAAGRPESVPRTAI